MNAPEESLDERVKASLIKLSAVSVKLNAASDELGRVGYLLDSGSPNL